MTRLLRGGRIAPSSRWEPYFVVPPPAPPLLTAYDLVIDIDNPVSHWKLGNPNTALDRKGVTNLPAVSGPIAIANGIVANNSTVADIRDSFTDASAPRDLTAYNPAW